MRASFFVPLLIALGIPGLASAQTVGGEPAEPAPTGGSLGHTSYSMRNLTGPANTINLYAGPGSNLDLNGFLLEPGLNQVFISDYELCFGGFGCTTVEIDDPLFAIIGGSFSPMNDLDVGALLLNMELAPDFEFNDPVVYGRYRLLTGSAEVACQLMFFLPLQGDFVAEAGAPVRFRGDLRIDTGLYIRFDDDGNFGLRAPLTVVTNLSEAFFLGGRTGLNVPDFDFGESYFPLELLLGYTIAGAGGPLADITLAGGFPFFIALGGQAEDYEELVTEIFRIALGVNAYFSL